MMAGVLFCILQSAGIVCAQEMDIYAPVPSEKIRVEASSEYPGFGAEETINGSGMKGRSHSSHNLGKTMWLSAISESPVKAGKQLREGAVWLRYQFNETQKLDLIEIWNHNQDNHTNRGLQKVYLQYSEDGAKWHTLKNGDHDFFILPKSGGRKEEPASFQLKLDGLRLKHFCITADLKEGNHYHNGSKSAIEDARWNNQNINYYGISEIRFYKKTKRDAGKLGEIADVTFLPAQGYRKTNDGPAREFRIKFDAPLFSGGKIELSVGNRKTVDQIPASEMGIYEFTSLFPPGLMEESATVDFKFESAQGSVEKRVEVDGARKWTVYFLPHSHLDIGYTHKHGEVMDVQLRNIDRALELVEQTKNYPQGSKFKWNLEATWPVTEYLDRFKNMPKAQSFKDAVWRGDMGLSASLGSILTGLCKQEELTHLFDDAHHIGQDLEIPVNSVMMSDIPGVSWGTVTAMTQNGIRYFSMAPNYVPFLETGGSRVGQSHKEWGDYPFYWQSQSGDEKVLLWSAGKGYSFFHDWLGGRLSSCGLEPIWKYLNDLEIKEFPYDMAYLRYTINGDNGPPDPEMPDAIRKWNEMYEYPKFVIGTTDELFTRFEKKYQDKIPVFRGDFTPYWEDGAASTAAELAMNRNNSERLNQLEILWAMIGCTAFPYADFYSAWRNIVLFSEHTWGASASGPEPESEFTKTLWKEKQAFALKADSLTNHIFQKAVSVISGNDKPKYIQVFNTNLWPRTDVVRLISSVDLSADILTDEQGTEIPVQKEGENTWVFMAKDVRPLSSKVYQIKTLTSEKLPVSSSLEINSNQISNGTISVTIDNKSGAISSLTDHRTGKEYAAETGLNEYIYTGRNASSPKFIASIHEIFTLYNGPVSATLRVVSDAPGCHLLTRDITLYEGISRVDIKNTLDKKNVYEYENVRFKFPFNIPNSEAVIDLAFGEMRPERDQLAGSNKNFYSANNGVTISGMKHSVLLTTLGCPILEIGEMTGEEWMKDRKEYLEWKRSTTTSPTVYSWAMNNSWRTNYKASQEGTVSFDYSIVPLQPYSQESKMRSAEIAQPLMAMFSDNDRAFETLFSLSGRNKIAVSTIRPSNDKSGYIVRLVNLSNQPARATIEWGSIKPAAIYVSDNKEQPIEKIENDSVWMKPFGTLTLKIEQKPLK
ncbi:MAG: hypothetical protein A2066_17460 [Bacteroidetes bacterium GWB2_41_8]|nr:MAG: hypothetical protein A2066_17460 [Bacteroidetes bacterium GWB2_41_8]